MPIINNLPCGGGMKIPDNDNYVPILLQCGTGSSPLIACPYKMSNYIQLSVVRQSTSTAINNGLIIYPLVNISATYQIQVNEAKVNNITLLAGNLYRLREAVSGSTLYYYFEAFNGSSFDILINFSTAGTSYFKHPLKFYSW